MKEEIQLNPSTENDSKGGEVPSSVVETGHLESDDEFEDSSYPGCSCCRPR